MKRTLLAALFLASLTSSMAQDVRLARFDAQRVFDQYGHTLDIRRKESNDRYRKRGRENDPEDLDALRELREKMTASVQRVRELEDSSKSDQFDAAARERLGNQLVAAKLTAQVDELRLLQQSTKWEQALQEESRRKLATLVREIWEGAARFGREQGFVIVVPQGMAEQFGCPTVASPEKFVDVTEALLTSLNERYAAGKKK